MLTHLIPISIWYYRWSRNSRPHFTDEAVETQAPLHCSSRSQSHMMAKWEGTLKNAEGSEGQLIKQILWLSGQGQFLEILVPTHMQFTREQLAYSISFWRVISFLDHSYHLLSCSKHASFCFTCSITSTCQVRTWRPFAYSHLATPGAGATTQSRACAGACRPPWVFSGSDRKAAGPKTACLTVVAPSNGTSYPWLSQVCRSVWTSVVCICVHVCLVASVMSDTLCDLMNCGPQAPQPMGFSRQEYWSGLPCLPPGDLPSPEIKPVPPALPGSFTTEPPGKPPYVFVCPTPYAVGNVKNVYGHWPYTAHVQAGKIAWGSG